ncbi:hypothetical protein [Criblamydia sequanensis]|uniref:Uncharacterized protein n=1 Tax=Candidatus Criblamydia sequanensis CRIB-18 TaxID=1437425 RepID=A0A090D0Z4_9BACT|nr:hypothetical protein [Criblamydia sequanensis]CDR33570.1 Conserved hypothetical protein [Criblamydia sequanensis CRIB-18]
MSKSDLLKSLKLMTTPVIFVLKEGPDIDQDFLDYSLLMLKVGPAERIPSPPVIEFAKEYICDTTHAQKSKKSRKSRYQTAKK